MMRTMAMNFGVPGEVYLANDKDSKQWLVLSSEELTSQANKWRVRRARFWAHRLEPGPGPDAAR